jgi:hypothetical protein
MRAGYADIEHSEDAPGPAEEIAEHIDWDATDAVRRAIGTTGMGIAEAMDTAQRFSLGWTSARMLIERTGKIELPGGFCAGASTDHREQVTTMSDLIDGTCEQIHVIRAAGGVPVILPMPLLPSLGTDADGYVAVYEQIARNCPEGPLLVHWLGPMFLPALEGYFPGDSFRRVMRSNPAVFRGAKLSMLDEALERELRAEFLQHDQVMLTGDDFHFGALIAGEGGVERTTMIGESEVPLGDFSHALLGIFDAIATPASLALRMLGGGNRAAYDTIMTRCEALGQCVFEEPTRFYKSGLAFLSWLNGQQDSPMLVNHEETRRDREHLLRVVHLANEAGAITNATTAQERLDGWLAG